MKKLFTIMLVAILSAAVFGGCAQEASSSATAAPPSDSAPTETPTAAPSLEPSPSPSDDAGNPKEKTYKEWTYYLDEKDSAVIDYGEDPPLIMKGTGGGDGRNLGVRGFNFDIIGDYIYVDSLDPDIYAGSGRTWSTTRMNPDGSDKKKLEYGNMSARLLKEDEQKFYFTVMGESAVYVSDYPCENVSAFIVNFPDKAEQDKKLGQEKELHLDLSGVENGFIHFTATYSTPEGIELYNGTYKMSADGQKIEKIKGTYIDISQELEAD